MSCLHVKSFPIMFSFSFIRVGFCFPTAPADRLSLSQVEGSLSAIRNELISISLTSRLSEVNEDFDLVRSDQRCFWFSPFCISNFHPSVLSAFCPRLSLFLSHQAICLLFSQSLSLYLFFFARLSYLLI